MTIQVVLRDQNWTPILMPPNVGFTVNTYEHSVRGGPFLAEVGAQGTGLALWELVEYLGLPITLHDDERGLKTVWWGYINELSITIDAMTFGISLSGVSNYVIVHYNTASPSQAGQNSVAADTVPYTDEGSIGAFGRRELRRTMSDTTMTAAEAVAASVLAERGRPLGAMEFAPRGGADSGRYEASVRCVGVYSSLAWRYYSQPNGLEAYTGGQADQGGQRLGLRREALYKLSFDSTIRAIIDIEGKLKNFKKDDRIVVSGAFLGNGTYTVDQIDSSPPITYTAGTISFLNVTRKSGARFGFTKDRLPQPKNLWISDRLGFMDVYKKGDRLIVSGAANAANNRTFTVKTPAKRAGTLAIQTNQIEFTAGSFSWIRSPTFPLLEYFEVGDVIQVTDAPNAALNGYYQIDDRGTGSGWNWLHVKQTPAVTVTAGSYQNPVTITVGNTLQVAEDAWGNGWNENIGANITIDLQPYVDAEGIAHPQIHHIRDTAGGLDRFRTDDVILVAGAADPQNNVYQRVKAKGPDGSFLVVEGYVINGTAGPPITLTAGMRMIVKEPIPDVYPSQIYNVRIELDRSWQVGQSFTVVSPETWSADKIEVLIRRIGNPTDAFRLLLYSGSASTPATLLDQVAVPANMIFDDFSWVVFDISNTQILNNTGTIYWIVLRRDGTPDPDNLYEVQIAYTQPDAYPRGAAFHSDYSAWYAMPAVNGRVPDLPFRVMGGWETTYQMQRMMADAERIGESYLQGFTGSAIVTPQYRDGETTALDELEKLMLIGANSNGRRRIEATVDINRDINFRVAPASPATTGERFRWTIDVGGRLYYDGLRVADADCPVGMWIKLKDIIPATANVERLADLSVQYVEGGVYDARARTLKIKTVGSVDAAEIGEVQRR